MAYGRKYLYIIKALLNSTLCVNDVRQQESWVNTQRLAQKSWCYELFCWDYAIGILLMSLIFSFTIGSTGEVKRSFLTDLRQAETSNIGNALLGEIIFNCANIQVTAAISIAGM